MKQNHIKKSLTTLVFSTLLISSNIVKADQTYASCDLNQDRCSSKPLTDQQFDKSIFLADKVNIKLEELYQKNLKKGRDLKVVLVARMGSDLSQFKILKDNQGRDSIQTIIDELVTESKQGASTDFNAQGAPNSISYQALMSRVEKYETLKYSHLGIAFRNLVIKDNKGQPITGPAQGEWAFLHLLYSCNKPENMQSGEYIKSSHIFRGTVASFFMDQLSGYKAQLIVPQQDVQDNLEKILVSENKVYNFQTNQYNAAARVNDLTQQNSNQFVLEAVAAALAATPSYSLAVSSREEAKIFLQNTGYAASKLAPSGLYTILNAAFIQKFISNMMPTVCFKSQPELKEYGVGEIVTSNSVVNWLQRNKGIESILEIDIGREIEKELSR